MSLIHPILFSDHFGVGASEFAAAGLLDPILNSDTKLFIDPLLVPKSSNTIIRRQGRKALDEGFTNVVELVAISERENDAAWKAALQNLNLDERPETGLGFGGASTRGASRPASVRQRIIRTAKEIVTLGEKNPAMIPLMALFEDGVGPDTLSDLATNLLLPSLAQITATFCAEHKIDVRDFGDRYGNQRLPANPFRAGEPVLLVPRDLLRDLPLAADWSDVSRVVFENREIRDAVNRMVGGLTKATVSEKKWALRRVSLSSLKNVREIIQAVAEASSPYDEEADLDGFYLFREVLAADRTPYLGMLTAARKKDATTLRETVEQIIELFTRMVEDNNLWELLWNKNTPRHERAAQLLFFSVANVICAANNVDISPETNSGGGPVDFKFSTGYHGRLLVEVKLSTGSVVHGYNRQLETYKEAHASDAIMLIIDVGRMGRKLTTIQKAKAAAEARGDKASEIFVVDGRRQKPASKR